MLTRTTYTGIVAVLAAGLSCASAANAYADCNAEIAAYQALIHNEDIRLKFSGRESDHPLVLKMSDGRAIDLTGYVAKPSPAESWMGDREVFQSVRTLVDKARQMADENEGGECDATLEEIKRITAQG